MVTIPREALPESGALHISLTVTSSYGLTDEASTIVIITAEDVPSVRLL